MKLKKEPSKFLLYDAGYDKGIQDAITVIMNILKDNNIRMAEKEFWKEYNLLKKEGKL